jgi:hypothetical protein
MWGVDFIVSVLFIFMYGYQRLYNILCRKIRSVKFNLYGFRFVHSFFKLITHTDSGTAVAQLLRYCATNRKVASSIPDGVIGIFADNPSDRTMALGSTQPLTGMSTRSISWRLMRPVHKAGNLTTIPCCCHEIWEP